MGGLQLQGLRGPARCTPSTTTSCRRWRTIGARARLRPCAVGDRQPQRRRQRQVRHDDGADAAAVLDRRLHRLDGGSLLRGVGHHAVPLPGGRGDVAASRRTPCASCATSTTTPRSACTYLQALGVQLRDGHAPPRPRRRPTPQPELTLHRRERPVEHLLGRRLRASSCRSTVQPVVVNHRGGDQRERNLELGTSWFQNQDEWAAMPADDGPDDWQRIDVAVDMSQEVPDLSRAAPSTTPTRRGRERRHRGREDRSSRCSRSTARSTGQSNVAHRRAVVVVRRRPGRACRCS